MVKSLIIAAPFSGSGKTIITLGLLRALQKKGIKIAPAKSGPDYIDAQFLAQAAKNAAINLDSWAMNKNQLQNLAFEHSKNHELLLIEGAMGLFDGAKGGRGSVADLAKKLNLPIILVIDCSKQAQSIGALIKGFAEFDKEINIVGVILNNIASEKHKALLFEGLAGQNIEIIGALYHDKKLKIPSRHLGLTLIDEIKNSEEFIEHSAKIITDGLNLEKIISLACELENADFQPPSSPVSLLPTPTPSFLPPLGQHITIAKDEAFAFIYHHFLLGWKKRGAQISFFSPLNNEAPSKNADAIFLPGGYPELYGERLAQNEIFFSGLKQAQQRGALIYGECGGFMVLGEILVDREGKKHKMSALLPISFHIDRPKRVLGYRYLSHNSPLPFAKNLTGHEFHYSSCTKPDLPPLFYAKDGFDNELAPMGAQMDNVMGSYAHIISSYCEGNNGG